MRWFVLALAVFTASPATAEGRLVIGPPSLEAWRTRFAHPEEWPQARARIGLFLFADHSLTAVPHAELRSWFAQARAWHIRVALDVGAIKEWGPAAEATLGAEQPIWDRLTWLGADIAPFAMDDPLIA